MKPKPFEILLSPQFDGEHWVYIMRVGDDEHEYTEHMRRAVLMTHAPALLHELKAAFELLLQVLDHHRDGKPLPPETDNAPRGPGYLECHRLGRRP